MKKIRIGHIGTFHDHSSGKLECVKRLSDIYELVGVVAESEKRYNEIKDNAPYNDVRFMTEEELFNAGVDAVMVEGHEFELVPAAQRCIDRGIHVHVDKPAGKDIAAFEHLLRSAKQKNLTVQMAYMYRYNPIIRKALDIVHSGKIGDVYAVETHMDCEHRKEKRQWLGQFDGGMMFFLGCHLMDLTALFQGVPEQIVPLNMATGIDTVTAEDYGMALMKYKNGISFAKTCAAEVGGFCRRQLVVCGTKGTLEIKPLEYYVDGDGGIITEMSETYSEDTKYNWGDFRRHSKSEAFYRYDAMMKEFAACVRGEMKNPYTYEYELQMQKMVLAACGMDIDFKEETVL